MLAPRSAEPASAASSTLQTLLIQLAGELYGMPSASVREVLRYRNYTLVPGAPATIPGVLSQRGTILPVVELRPLLGLDVTSVTRASRLVSISHAEIELALTVDAVLDLVTLDMAELEPLPAVLDSAKARLLRGLVQHDQQRVALLDLDALIAVLRAGT